MDINDKMRQRILLGGALTLFVVLLLIAPMVINVEGTTAQPPTPPTTAAAAPCAETVNYFAYEVAPNFFGPASSFETVQTQRDELHRRRCQDPALLVSHIQYWNGVFSTPEQRQAEVESLLANRQAWRDAVTMLEVGETTHCTASLATMSGAYNTLYMVKGADANQIPAIYQTTPDRPEFAVLRFDCDTGKQFNYKLDCGFQPVDTNFPGVPGPPETPPVTTTGPPVSVTRPVPNTTIPVCPPQGCKPVVAPTPAMCADPANPCQPGVGPPTPRPAASSIPQATVVSPTSQLPPPAPLPQPQPTVSVPISSPVTAPV
jgi:hypothetical protein